MTTSPACADLATPARVIELLDDGMARVETCTFGIGFHVHAKHQGRRDEQDPCAYT